MRHRPVKEGVADGELALAAAGEGAVRERDGERVARHEDEGDLLARPQQRLQLSTYLDIGLWALWRPTLLHFSFMHILFNSLWWFILARPIERHDGVLPLLALVLICGLAGNAVQWWYAGPSFGGVSGVTMGMLGWVGLRLRRVPYAVPTMLLPVMVGWMVISVALDTVIPGTSGTAHGAHIGGLISGFLLAALWPVKQSQSPPEV